MRWCSAFPASQVCFCAGILTWEVTTSPHFERGSHQSAASPHPSPGSPETCTRRSSWESCQSSSLSSQWLFWGKLQTTAEWNGMRFDFVCWEKNNCEILWKTLRTGAFFHPFFLIHLASGKECMQVACMKIKCQIWNQLLVPGKPQQVSKEKEKPKFNCKAEVHRRAADLLSVKCQYQCNKDGTQ